jgi:hypothetical protein
MSAPASPVPSQPFPSPESTDPGAMDVIESLFRDSSQRRSALRPYESTLHPPEGADDYGWLYRPGDPLAAADGAAAVDAITLAPVLGSRLRSRGRLRPGLLAGGLTLAALVALLLVLPL